MKLMSNQIKMEYLSQEYLNDLERNDAIIPQSVFFKDLSNNTKKVLRNRYGSLCLELCDNELDEEVFDYSIFVEDFRLTFDTPKRVFTNQVIESYETFKDVFYDDAESVAPTLYKESIKEHDDTGEYCY